MTSVTKDDISSIRRSMAATTTAITTHEGTTGGCGTPKDRLADKEARNEVEEGTPTGAISSSGTNDCLRDGGNAVAEHGTLGRRERALGAVPLKPNLEGNCGSVVDAKRAP